MCCHPQQGGDSPSIQFHSCSIRLALRSLSFRDQRSACQTHLSPTIVAFLSLRTPRLTLVFECLAPPSYTRRQSPSHRAHNVASHDRNCRQGLAMDEECTDGYPDRTARHLLSRRLHHRRRNHTAILGCCTPRSSLQAATRPCREPHTIRALSTNVGYLTAHKGRKTWS